ncbi:hypothetical protein FHS57_001653 [Runella defluvii]|uniref:Protein phosphatase 2C domain-containing protein n=1 Tax=Runella defluvii TaxID=370973 RepID=A0A7W5ZKW4_9BACT|nr:PP2C family serine/threonine-protein phosphatase [Runella defluvii]MBB3837656.1 hypothetical protein [Runella defluvii]
MEIECHRASVANFIDKREFENEDAIHINHSQEEPFSSFVLCDGAGGSGVFCKEWAKFLAERVPLNPMHFFMPSENWYSETCRLFYENVIEKKDLSDLILNKKVHRDGSYSTFCACWVDKINNKLIFSSIGDTCVFYFVHRDDTFHLTYITSINKQHSIDDSPELLNWNMEGNKAFPHKEFSVNSPFYVVLASDSLAKWMLLHLYILDLPFFEPINFEESFLRSLVSDKYLALKEDFKKRYSFSSCEDYINELYIISNSNDVFKEHLKSLYLKKEIEIDDYSLIVIKGNVSE